MSKASAVSSKPLSVQRPSTAPTNTQTKTTRVAKPQSSSSASKVTTKLATPKTTPSKPTNGMAKRVLKPTKPSAAPTAVPTTTAKASKETIDEFFGEKKKTSSKQLFVLEQEEMTELEGKGKSSVDEETEQPEMIATETPCENTELIDAYLQKKKGQNKLIRN